MKLRYREETRLRLRLADSDIPETLPAPDQVAFDCFPVVPDEEAKDSRPYRGVKSFLTISGKPLRIYARSAQNLSGTYPLRLETTEMLSAHDFNVFNGQLDEDVTEPMTDFHAGRLVRLTTMLDAVSSAIEDPDLNPRA